MLDRVLQSDSPESIAQWAAECYQDGDLVQTFLADEVKKCLDLMLNKRIRKKESLEVIHELKSVSALFNQRKGLFACALQRGDRDVLLALSQGDDLTTDESSVSWQDQCKADEMLQKATAQEDIELLYALLKSHVCSKLEGSMCKTLVLLAADHGDQRLLDALLLSEDYEIDTETMDYALRYAALGGHIEVIQKLLGFVLIVGQLSEDSKEAILAVAAQNERGDVTRTLKQNSNF